MDLPDKSHPVWRMLINNQNEYAFKFLATKIILGRLALQYKYSPTESMMAKAVEELQTFFERNKRSPYVKADLKMIFGEGVDL